MCGLAGFFSSEPILAEADLRRMTDCLSHRGPDAGGYYFEANIGLGHRRLSIIDLSESANQPMVSHSGRYLIIFNGEVYNFREIAQELDVPLKTTGDTEVVLEAFAKWGPDFVQKLNGMFAIAIYDKELHELHLYRDRIGIKPIYYFWDGVTFVFGSELKALLEIDLVNQSKAINKQALNAYLYLGYIPQPLSIYSNIHKFPQGSYGLVQRSQLSVRPYWRLEDQIEPNVVTDEANAKARLKELVLSSVKYRLISDVPFGTFLSGGIDSSLVTAAAQQVSNSPINTFSIGFKESPKNESEHAARVAKYLGTHHHEFMVSHREAIALFEDIIDVYDEPFADSSSVPTMLVSKLARQHVTMALSGDGGDETYMGYGFYQWANRLSNPLIKLFRRPIGALLSTSSSKFERASHLFRYPDEAQVKSHIFSQEQYYFTQQELNIVLQPEWLQAYPLEEDFKGLPRKLRPAEEQALFDLKYYMPDDLLVKVDRASMKYSLEVRVPLLDYRLVAFALNVDESLKLRGKDSKYLLKQVLYDMVPAEYFARPKWGFGMPLIQWLKTDLRHLIDEYLNEKVTQQVGIVQWEKVQPLVRQYLNGKDYLYNRIWLLIILHRWYLKNF
ncbi:MAG: asparagine synthase (glutamine-hydrolyzing) [Chitinophagales bacterium]|nr:asparagine synthase (glutamine-hydrolyzing) [Chitinophagales bacterium]